MSLCSAASGAAKITGRAMALQRPQCRPLPVETVPPHPPPPRCPKKSRGPGLALATPGAPNPVPPPPPKPGKDPAPQAPRFWPLSTYFRPPTRKHRVGPPAKETSTAVLPQFSRGPKAFLFFLGPRKTPGPAPSVPSKPDNIQGKGLPGVGVASVLSPAPNLQCAPSPVPTPRMFPPPPNQTSPGPKETRVPGPAPQTQPSKRGGLVLWSKICFVFHHHLNFPRKNSLGKFLCGKPRTDPRPRWYPTNAAPPGEK